MRKLDSLRAAIEAAVPELAREPGNLRIWVDRGAASSPMTASHSLGFTYRANLLIVNMVTDIAVLALAIFRWMRVNQPNLMAPNTDGFAFDVDVLDNKSVDVQIQIDLTENVKVTPNEDGSSALEYLAEPDPLFDDFADAGATGPSPPPLSAIGQQGEGWLADIDNQM